MAQSPYLIQIVYRQSPETVVRLEPGLQAEKDLVQALVDELDSRPVGVFHTRARVQAEVEAALDKVLMDLKRQVKPR